MSVIQQPTKKEEKPEVKTESVDTPVYDDSPSAYEARRQAALDAAAGQGGS